MTSIRRTPDELCDEPFDVIVVGGGIYGACLLLEASRRGLRTLLLERDDFGGATSWNSLRIIHGGLRYLQNVDLGRFHRSVAEQTWWLHHFPDLVEPLPCLMPLYNRGLRRTDVMRFALGMNDALARPARERVRTEEPAHSLSIAHEDLPAGQIIGVEETRERFPDVDTRSLRGGARWWDAHMVNPPRLMMEILRWATACGGRALNYLPCREFIREHRRVVGVRSWCRVSEREYEFRGQHIVNCAGPWAQELTQTGSVKSFARAFNVLLDQTPMSPDALALTAPRARSTWFMLPHGTASLLGTVHLEPADKLDPSEEEVASLLAGVNEVLRQPVLRNEQVIRILSGRLPALTHGSHEPAKSPTIKIHDGSLAGVTSVKGVKYTTARRIAQRTLERVLCDSGMPSCKGMPRPTPAPRPTPTHATDRELHDWMLEESVVHVDDFLLRRQNDLRRPIDTQLAQRLLRILDTESTGNRPASDHSAD